MATTLHNRRMARLEQVSRQLRGLYHNHAECIVAEKNAKAELYLANAEDGRSRSHAEREGYASAKGVRQVTDTILVLAQIRTLEEERDFLKFSIQHDPADDDVTDTLEAGDVTGEVATVG